jgi:hypothetical protein
LVGDVTRDLKATIELTEVERSNLPGKGESWEISRDGKIYRYGHEVPTTTDIAGWPTIDLGQDYTGKVPRAGNTTKRLVDELVAEAFLGVTAFHNKRILHLDGNPQNPAADNLHVWVSDAYKEAKQYPYYSTVNRMFKYPTAALNPRQRRDAKAKELPDPLFTDSSGRPTTPVSNKAKAS